MVRLPAPLIQRLAALLRPLSTRALAILEARRQSEGHVFSYQDHHLGTVKTAWKTAFKRAGLRHVRFHDLRHTLNTRLLEAGVLQESARPSWATPAGLACTGNTPTSSCR